MTETTNETPEPKAASKTTATNSVSPSLVIPREVYGKGETDEVRLSAIKYKNKNARKSLSVLHVQRALVLRGYDRAGADPQGYFGDETQAALWDYQEKEGIEPTAVPDAQTLQRLFEDDPNITLALF